MVTANMLAGTDVFRKYLIFGTISIRTIIQRCPMKFRRLAIRPDAVQALQNPFQRFQLPAEIAFQQTITHSTIERVANVVEYGAVPRPTSLVVSFPQHMTHSASDIAGPELGVPPCHHWEPTARQAAQNDLTVLTPDFAKRR
jgi:hypothetical protein